MTMVAPGSGDLRGMPSYPWSPQMIEELAEAERAGYLSALRDARKQYAKAGK